MTRHDDVRPGKPPQQEIVKMFRESVGPYSKALVALHPHLYESGLYHRASEVKALDKILGQLSQVSVEAKSQNYKNLPPLLDAIKEALNGNPQLSWWNLVTLSVGQALATANDEETNTEEKEYLAKISEILTEIIRHYNSPNTKLLLEIRLTALEVDSRLVELDKLPQNMKEPDEALDYISSEFRLLNKELERVKNTPSNVWNKDTKTLLDYVSKTNQLIRVLQNIKQTNPDTYQKFLKQNHLQTLYERISLLIQESILIPDPSNLDIWQNQQLEAFFELFLRFPDVILLINTIDLCTLLKLSEQHFVEDTNLEKVRPAIFSSNELKSYITVRNIEFSKLQDHLRAVVRGLKEDRSITQNPVNFYKRRLMEENDLHHICAMVRFKPKDYQPPSDLKEPQQIQRESLTRMNSMVSASQPKDLDAALKSFTDEEKENRYYLTQEVILEQFIRWRKQGIY